MFPVVSSRTVQQAYSSIAPVYIDLFGSVDTVHPDDLAVISRHLGQAEGPVVDFGCGPGHLTEFLQSAGCEVTGVDPVPEFIEHARRTHPRTRFEVGSLADLASMTEPAAGVLAWYSLIHLEPEQLVGALDLISRSTRPGAVLVVGFFDGIAVEPFAHKVATAYRWPVDEMAALLADAGFVEVERLRRGQQGERRPHAVLVATRAARP